MAILSDRRKQASLLLALKRLMYDIPLHSIPSRCSLCCKIVLFPHLLSLSLSLSVSLSLFPSISRCSLCCETVLFPHLISLCLSVALWLLGFSFNLGLSYPICLWPGYDLNSLVVLCAYLLKSPALFLCKLYTYCITYCHVSRHWTSKEHFPIGERGSGAHHVSGTSHGAPEQTVPHYTRRKNHRRFRINEGATAWSNTPDLRSMFSVLKAAISGAIKCKIGFYSNGYHENNN